MAKFKFRPDRNNSFGVTCPLVPENPIFDRAWRIVTLDLNHAGNEDSHKVTDEFDFGQIRLFTLKLLALER